MIATITRHLTSWNGVIVGTQGIVKGRVIDERSVCSGELERALASWDGH